MRAGNPSDWASVSGIDLGERTRESVEDLSCRGSSRDSSRGIRRTEHVDPFAPSRVSVFWVDTRLDDERLQASSALLNASELERASRFRFPVDRNRFVAARAAVRTLLGSTLQMAPEAVGFDVGPWGKPCLDVATGKRATDCWSGTVEFNIAHSGDWAVVALGARYALGVDVERVAPERAELSIARRFFAPGEVAALERLAPEDRIGAFFRCWSRKEAFIKATGEGLHRELDSFEVSLDAREGARLIAVDGDAESTWQLWHLDAPECYSASLVTADRVKVVHIEALPGQKT